jgi:hypothetical protein
MPRELFAYASSCRRVERSIYDNDGKGGGEREVSNIKVAEKPHEGGFVLQTVSERGGDLAYKGADRP